MPPTAPWASSTLPGHGHLFLTGSFLPQHGQPFLGVGIPPSAQPALLCHRHPSLSMVMLPLGSCSRGLPGARMNLQEVPRADISPPESESSRRHPWRRMQMSTEDNGDLHGKEFALSFPRLCFLPIPTSPRVRHDSSLPCRCQECPSTVSSSSSRQTRCANASLSPTAGLSPPHGCFSIFWEGNNPRRAAERNAGQPPASLRAPRRWRSTRCPAQK